MAVLLLLCQREEAADLSWISDLGYFSSTGGERDFLPGEVQISREPDLECFLTGDDDWKSAGDTLDPLPL